MPAAPLDVNWEAVRAHAVVHGIRPTAEHYGIAPGTLFARSSREGWLKPATPQHLTPVPATMKPIASNACKPHEAAAVAMAEYSGNTRLNLAKTADKLSGKFASMDEDELIAVTPAIKDTATIAEKVHGWNRETGERGALVQINIAAGGAEHTAPVIDIDGL